MRTCNPLCLFFSDVPRVLRQGLCPCCQAEVDGAVAELNRELAGQEAWYLRPENAGFAAREREWSKRNCRLLRHQDASTHYSDENGGRGFHSSPVDDSGTSSGFESHFTLLQTMSWGQAP
ncbi:hypothetical protein SMMN14_03199 [Sphaerulina musiva]